MPTTNTTSTSLSDALRAHGFVGRVVEPADTGYDAARACWNAAVDRAPSAVAYATDVADVSAAVRAARAAGMPFTIRSGGHSVSGRSVRDRALCIDMRGLSQVRVDPGSRLVEVGGGALLGELDAATQEHGLAVPAGQISHTGVGGLTLGGGLGWLMRRHGLTVDSLAGAEVVLADGSVVEASEDSDPDLLWALRGGGGDFGAVTRFRFRAHRVGPAVLAGMLVYPWERAGEALRLARELMEDAPDELTTFAVLLTAPPEPPFPPELRGKPIAAISIAWCGEIAAGERALEPLRSRSRPALDLVAPMPYVALQSMLDQTAPHGWHYHDRMHLLDEVSDNVVEALLAGYERTPTPQSHIITGWMGGAVDRAEPGATAFGHRGAKAETWLIGSSTESVDPVRAWVRETSAAIEPLARAGTYVNALEADRPVAAAYEAGLLERLEAVKRRYDPDGAFSGNGIA
jgi:FAD/FMN-containing dehydrogenase